MLTFEAIEDLVRAALLNESIVAAGIFNEPNNRREYICSIKGCNRHAYAKGLCNAHYMRSRSGKDMSVPLKARKRDDVCVECGEKTGSKGGWGLCVRHYKKKRRTVIKKALVTAMGGACGRCGGEFDLAVFDFHHVGEKEVSPSNVIDTRNPKAIAEELSKCVLLCANCHRLEHKNDY